MESRIYAVKVAIALLTCLVAYQLEARLPDGYGGACIGSIEVAAELLAIGWLLSPQRNRRAAVSAWLCMIGFFVCLLAGDTAYLVLYYILHVRPDTCAKAFLVKMPYAAAFLLGAAMPVLSLPARQRSSLIFSHFFLGSLLVVVFVAATYLIAPLWSLEPLRRQSAPPSYFVLLVAQGLDILAMISFAAIYVVVVIRSAGLPWAVHGASALILVLCDWAVQLQTPLGSVPQSGFYEYCWAFGIFMCVASLFCKGTDIIGRPLRLTHPGAATVTPSTALDTWTRLIILTTALIPIVMFCLLAEKSNVAALRVVSISTGLSILGGLLGAHLILRVMVDNAIRTATRHNAPAATPLPAFYDHGGTYDTSVFIMSRFPRHGVTEDEQLRALIDCVTAKLKENGYYPRTALEDRPYQPLLWDNVETYLTSCRYGVAIVEQRRDGTYNPNVAMEWGWMRAMNKRVLFLVEKGYTALPADFGGLIRSEFTWDNPRDEIVAAIERHFPLEENSLSAHAMI